ncbi:MAG: hypothetical protein GYA24_13180 [Candidatus Lokiarchaeota archaeon]|nr:hypothetical protein [Candidatus Lokiarchaeota archaeon]
MSFIEHATLIVTDDQRIARHLHSILDKNPKKTSPDPAGLFFVARAGKKKYIIISTNGHLQLFQNSSIYKWSGIDPKKIIEDDNSVIPVLNSFNKKSFYTLQKILQTERISEAILALVPDINAITIGLKEVGNVLHKAGYDRPPKKVMLHSLDPVTILDQLGKASGFPFDDIKAAEIEQLRSYLDAVISFSITQEITYTIKRCIEIASPSFKELKDILAQDARESKNLLIPLSRAQALILLLVHANNKLLAKDPASIEAGQHVVHARIVQPGGARVDVPVNNITFPDMASARTFVESMKNERHVRIGTITSTEIRLQPPSLFDLTSLIEQVSGETGFPTNYTYKILLDMYYSRMISYPNPERDPAGFISLDHVAMLKEFAAIDEFEDIGKAALDHQQRNAGVRGEMAPRVATVGIFPLQVQGKNSPFFKGRPNYWKIYVVLVRRYMLQFLPPAIIVENRISIMLKDHPSASINSWKIEDEGFAHHCKEGYLARYTGFSFDVLKSLEIEAFSIHPVAKPRAFYTDASLLAEIKNYNLGDTVSHLFMIEKLITNNYLQVVNKNLKLTKRGELIADFLKETFAFLGSLEFTTFFMKALQGIHAVASPAEMQGAIVAARKAVLAEYLAQFSRARERTNDFLLKQGINLSMNGEGIFDAEQKGRFALAPELHLFCPCGSPMKVIETKTKTRFLACENRLGCGKTAALPRDGKIEVMDKACKICGKNVLRIESADRGTYFFCPICWMESYSQAHGESLGYCVTCDTFNACWTAEEVSNHESSLAALALQHETGYDKCPRCQKSRMIMVQDASEGAAAKLVCENPLCNFKLVIPQRFTGKMERTEKKCLICPMNAVLVTVKEGTSFHVCINCYNQHLKRKEEQIGFCLGCMYHDACFTNELKHLEIKESIRDSIRKRMNEASTSKE